MRARLSVLAVPLAALLALGPAVAPASAVTTIAVGSNAVSNSVCNGQTRIQVKSPDGSYRVPVDGVITSWTYRSTWTIVASSPKVPVALGLQTVPSRVPVKTGDLLGWGANFYRGCGGPVAGYDVVNADDDTESGPVYSDPVQTGFQLNLSAVVELDDDGDGFGDATQDKCPTSATTQGPCPTPPAAAPVVPDTALTSLTAAKAKRSKAKAAVTAVFTGTSAAGFECAVDSPVFTRCASPYVVKLRPGPHTLAVRAISSTGLVDPTAAVRTVKVRSAKR